MDSIHDGDGRPNLIRPVGYSSSNCGYCKGSKSSKSYGVWAYRSNAAAYEKLIEHGWRRSGSYIYKPDCGYNGSCCAQVAIRLDVDKFRPTRQQKRSVALADRILRSDSSPVEEGSPSRTATIQGPARARGKFARVWDVEQELMRLESNVLEDDQRDLNRMHEVRSQQARRARRGNGDPLRPLLPPLRQHLKTSLHLASSSPEKYELFRKYQADVHGQTLEQISDISGFERFLCDAPFPANADDNKVHRPVDLDAADAIPLGLYHMEWRLDGKLIALGVLDVLPRYVSSVYLVYDSAYAHMQIGKLSALREIALTKQLRRKGGMHTLQYYTMGLYIHSCVKMRYKAQYGPAQLLDPLVNKWFDFASIRRQLDIGQRYDFIHPLASRQAATPSNQTQTEEDKESDEEDLDLPTPPPPGIEEVSDLRLSSLLRCLILRHGEVSLLVNDISRLPERDRKQSLECASALNEVKSLFVFVL